MNITTDRVHSAIIFATKAHMGQTRKATDLPYIIHPMEVLQLLCEMDAVEDLKLAGLLHDTLEDTNITAEDIEDNFGKNVLNLVLSNSENKALSWQLRKQHTIDSLKTASKEVQMLILADKLSNLKSMLEDYSQQGEMLWTRFNAPKEKQKWYYGGIIDSLKPLQNDSCCRDSYAKLVNIYTQLFE